jgi:PKD domain
VTSPTARRPVVDGRRVSRTLSILVLTIGGLLFGGWQAVAAGAKVYCVAPATGCSDGNQPTLQAALTQVKTDGAAGRIVLGSSTYVGPAAGFSYSGALPVEIDGVNSSATTLALPAADNIKSVLTSSSTGAVKVSSLAVRLSSGSTGDTGLHLAGPATVSNVVVDGTPASNPSYGIMLAGGGSVSGTTVTMPTVGSADALDISGSAATTVQDSTFTGVSGIVANGPGPVDIHRSVLAGTTAIGGNNGTALLAFGGPVSADDSLLRASGTSGMSATGLLVFTPGSTSATVKATQLTIVGNASDIGAMTEALGSGTATLNLTDSIIADPIGFSVDAERSGSGGSSATIDYSDLDPSRAGTSGGASVTLSSHVVPSYVNPGFANPGSDFRLLATSPLLDFDPTALGNTPLGAAESATDLSGAPRITGTGRDLGAYQHQPPTVTASVAPASVETGVPATFTAVGAASTPGDTFTYGWRFDDGTTASGPSVLHAFSTKGTHSAVVTVTDTTRLTATAFTTLPVTPTPPSITGARESHSRWRRGNRLALIARRHRPPVGTTFSFNLNESALVRFAFTQRIAGRRVGKRCVAQAKRHRHASRCSRTVTVAAMTFVGHTGINRVSFQGRVSRMKKLPPGRYVLVITATNAAAQRSAPRSLAFTIVKR